MSKRIYVVENTETSNSTLVRAASKAQAISAVANRQYSARPAKPDDVIGFNREDIVVASGDDAEPAGEHGEAS